MTIEEYENQGGFREELGVVRAIGQKLVTLKEYMNTRPARFAEPDAIKKVEAALDNLRAEIIATRNGLGGGQGVILITIKIEDDGLGTTPSTLNTEIQFQHTTMTTASEHKLADAFDAMIKEWIKVQASKGANAEMFERDTPPSL